MTTSALPPHAPSTVQRPKPAVSRRRAGGWLLAFACFQFACQLLLLIPSFGPARLFIRIAAFSGSIALVWLLPEGGAKAPPTAVQWWAYLVLLILGFEALNPEGTYPGWMAALALYFGILGPIFWVRRLEVTPAALQKLMILMWLFYTTSAALGVLQTYFPGQFQPPLSSVLASRGSGVIQSLEIKLATGEHVFRPMGLTDSPGAASYGAVYAVLLGLGLLQSKKPFFAARALAILSIVIGLVCLYLCQVRAAIVMLAICVFVLIVLTAVSGQVSRFLIGVAVVAVTVPIAFSLALSLGGHEMTERLTTLIQGDPSTIYYKNRGVFLEHTINTLLPLYPLGAGLGRWGMINVYFGSPAGSIYVEIQWTSWLLDGGVPMIVVYLCLVLTATWTSFRGAISRVTTSALGIWPSVIVAYNVGALALCFSYVEFIGTSGLEFWLLNGALMAAMSQLREAPSLQT